MKLADKIKALPRKGLYPDIYRLGVLDAAELATAHDALMQQMAEAAEQLDLFMPFDWAFEHNPDYMGQPDFKAAVAKMRAALRAYKEQQ